MKFFIKIVLVYCAFAFIGCSKEQISVADNNSKGSELQFKGVLSPPPSGFYDVVNYSFYPSLTIAQYALKARTNAVWNGYANKQSVYGNVLISNITSYRNGLPSVARAEFDGFISQFNNSAYWPKWFTFSDGQKYVVYRNWTYTASKPKPFIIRPADMTWATTSPFYYLDGFISCNLDPLSAISFGLPQKIISMPATLKLTQEWGSGNPGHIGVKPVSNNINQANLQVQMDLITVEVAQ